MTRPPGCATETRRVPQSESSGEPCTPCQVPRLPFDGSPSTIPRRMESERPSAVSMRPSTRDATRGWTSSTGHCRLGISRIQRSVETPSSSFMSRERCETGDGELPWPAMSIVHRFITSRRALGREAPQLRDIRDSTPGRCPCIPNRVSVRTMCRA